MKFIYSLLMFSLSLFAADSFVSAEFVQKNLTNNKIVLIDVGSNEDYLAGHIPGAMHTDMSDWREKHGSHQLMKSSKKIETLLQNLGVNKDSHVIIYGHNKEKEILKTSYAALAIIVNGHNNVSILNGAFDEWKFDSDRAISTSQTTSKKGNFKAQFNKNILVNKAFVEKNLYKIPMIEARPPQFYFGILESKGVKRLGHIPGAMSYYWKNSFQEDETVQDKATLKEILIKGMKLKPNKTMLAYCTGGLEASMNWYILTKALGFKDVKIYDGSMREWGNDMKTPMIRYRWEAFSK